MPVSFFIVASKCNIVYNDIVEIKLNGKLVKLLNGTEKTINLFQYIRDVSASKQNVVTDIKKENWYQFLDEIPIHTHFIKCPFLDTSNIDDMEENIILEVMQPGLEPCPKAPDYIEPWLSTDWKVASNQLNFKEKVIKKEGSKQRVITFGDFFSNPEYQKGLSDWMEKRAQWVQDLPKQKKPEKIDKFFRSIWNQYEILNQNSECFELLIGQGILHQKQNDTVFYPVLLKKVSMIFDTEDNAIRVIDINAKPELNIAFLKKLGNISDEVINTVVKDLHKHNYPLLDKTNTRYFVDDYNKPSDTADTDSFLENLIQKIDSTGAYYKDVKQAVHAKSETLMYNRPVLFIRNIKNDILQSLDSIIGEIKQKGEVSEVLLNLMGENTVSYSPKLEKKTLSTIRGEKENVLFSKEANKEQLDIAQNIEYANAVLVQTPPGTGEIHTITNLLGHFLAQGKSVLVTSPIQKIVSDIKQKMIKELQNFCVFGSEGNEIEQFIDTVIKQSSNYTSEDMLGDAGVLERKRKEILKRLSEIRKEMYDIQQREYDTITLYGKEYTIKQAADYVCKNREKLCYIPGRKIALQKQLPVSKEELEILYQTNANVTQKQELELEFSLPEPQQVMSPQMFEDSMTEKNRYTAELLKLQGKIRDKISIDFQNGIAKIQQEPLYTNLNSKKIEEIKEIFSKYEPKQYSEWQLSAIFAGKNKDTSGEKWRDLIKTIKEAHEYHDYGVEKTFRKDIDIAEEYISYKSIDILKKLQESFQKGKKIGGLSFLIHKDWKELYESLKVNEKQVSNAEDCEVLIATIYIELKRSEMEKLWIELIEEQGGEFFYTLGMEPEQKGMEAVEKIEECLNWYQAVYQPIKNIALECGLSAKCFDIIGDIESPIEEAKYDIDFIYKFLPQYISISELLGIKLSGGINGLDKTIALLQSEKFAKSSICNAMLSALQEKDIEKYQKHYDELLTAYNKFDEVNKRKRILEKIAVDAPAWATAIQYRTGIHGASECPPNVEEAWKWKQVSIMLDEIINQPFEQLQKEQNTLNKEFQDTTIKLIECRTWHYILLHLEKDKKKKQYLQQLKQSITDGQNLFSQFQYIIPAYIMPINQVLEKLNVNENKFDIVIIDKANQCDISALTMLHIAKKVIIMGDDEQISGIHAEENEKQLYSYTNGEILNKSIYNTKCSLYDIAKTVFQPFMLTEHFRCMPNIIKYNNRLCYHDKMKLLRDNRETFVKPSVVCCGVNGKCDNNKNIKEAKNVVAFMMACMEQPEYKDMTFGAISLLDIEQANLIRQIAFQKISPKEYEKRKILCETVPHFQNEERDIMFLSATESYNNESFVTLQKNDTEQSIRQMYNVAISRAKNQLWFIHSFDVSNDLEADDIRRDFIEYAQSANDNTNNTQSNSYFETTVANILTRQGYPIIQQKMVGNYKISMVAIQGDKKVAIDCHGEEQYNGKENVLLNMEKQSVLERMGWKFIHIRSSEYFNNPKETIKRVIVELIALGFVKAVQNNTNAQDNVLLQKIQNRAQHIVQEWEKETLGI